MSASPPRQGVDAQTYLHPRTLARLGTMELRAKMIVEGINVGMHRSPYQGFSVEFAQHRPYVPGDDIRNLDWKVYARTDRLHLKQHQQETNLDLVLMLDASGSMDYSSRSFAEASGTGTKTSPDGRDYWSKYDHATALAAALSYITLRQGDRVGLAIYADTVRALVARSSRKGTWREIVAELASRPVSAQTQTARAVDEVLARITNRCLVVILSDFFDDPEQIRAALARIRHRGHDAILFQILDRRELSLDVGDSVLFTGLEGEAPMRVEPRAIRKAYQEGLQAHIELVQDMANRFGFDYQSITTDGWLGPPLAEFVARRNARIKRSKYG